MLVQLDAVLTPDQVAHCRKVLETLDWVDGRITAGAQSAQAKHNLQAPQSAPEAQDLGDMILGALGQHQTFVSAGLPLRVFPPLFNRYDAGMAFGAHIDNSIRFAGPVRFRTDLSITLFLNDPDEYEGGELIVEDTYGEHAVKLAAGDAILYPASSLHRVAPVTRGSRWAAFFWAQSMVRSDERRALLFELDSTVQALTPLVGQTAEPLIRLTGLYHNLIRMWADV
jgi:PKHD-type hydroxylase